MACFEIIADQQSTEGGVFQARDEGILGWAVDENAVLLERCQGEDSWGCDFRVIFFDGFSYIFIGIVHSWNNKWVSFGVGSPKNYDCAQVVFLLESSNIIPDNLQVFGFFIAGEEVIGSVLLVGSDEVRVVDWFQRFVVFEEGLQLLLQLIVEDLCASHGAGKIQRVDIPSSNNEIFWVDQRNDFLDLHEDLSIDWICYFHGGALGHWSEHVGSLHSLLGVPGKFFFVCDDAAENGGSVVASDSYHHQSYSSCVFGSLEVIVDVVDFGGDAVGRWDGSDGSVGVLGVDILFAVGDGLALDE